MLPQDTIPEVWLPVVGYEGWYSVSSLGRVRRDAGGWGARAGRILQPGIHRYCRVVLHRDGVGRPRGVHQLVAAAFLGPCPPGYTVNHLDGVKTHNTPSNLEYCTHIEQMKHAKRLGLFPTGDRSSVRMNMASRPRGDAHPFHRHPEWAPRGERNSHARLTVGDVQEIRRLYATGTLTRAELARQFRIPHGHVCRIVTYRAWKHI